MKDLLFAQGDISNVLKRIGEYKSNLFCIGEDPVTKSGVIVSNGEIVSSKILDITLKEYISDDSVLSYINKLEVKYIDSETKQIKTMYFNILNDEALNLVIKIISEKQQFLEKVEKIDKNQLIFDEKLKKIQYFLSENKNQIECIDELKNELIQINNKLDILLTERALRIK